jgi:hypothetical protein
VTPLGDGSGAAESRPYLLSESINGRPSSVRTTRRPCINRAATNARRVLNPSVRPEQTGTSSLVGAFLSPDSRVNVGASRVPLDLGKVNSRPRPPLWSGLFLAYREWHCPERRRSQPSRSAGGGVGYQKDALRRDCRRAFRSPSKGADHRSDGNSRKWLRWFLGTSGPLHRYVRRTNRG